MNELDTRALDVLEYIKDCSSDGVPPSVREICTVLGIKSTSTAHKYLKQLEHAGYITRGNGQNRAIRLAGEKTARVPVMGTVTAGVPITAVQNVEGYISFSSHQYDTRELFALRVRGDSMVNAAILDGDIVIVRKTPSAENGEIVVAMLEDAATVKRFYRENGHFRLQPENDSMDPIMADNVSVLGKVVSVIRYY